MSIDFAAIGERMMREERDNERPPLKWFRVRDKAALDRIPGFVKSQRVNTFGYPRQDRKGDWIMLLGWDDKPDSDWGKFRGNRAAIWFASEELAAAGEAFVMKGLGWEPASGMSAGTAETQSGSGLQPASPTAESGDAQRRSA